MAEFLDTFVVGQCTREVLRLAPFDEVVPNVFVFAVETQVFLDGALCPYPDSLAAQLGVDAPDGAFRFGHGGHHGVGLGCGDVAVLVDGEPVH